jgi:hypothetical protein
LGVIDLGLILRGRGWLCAGLWDVTRERFDNCRNPRRRAAGAATTAVLTAAAAVAASPSAASSFFVTHRRFFSSLQVLMLAKYPPHESRRVAIGPKTRLSAPQPPRPCCCCCSCCCWPWIGTVASWQRMIAQEFPTDHVSRLGAWPRALSWHLTITTRLRAARSGVGLGVGFGGARSELPTTRQPPRRQAQPRQPYVARLSPAASSPRRSTPP